MVDVHMFLQLVLGVEGLVAEGAGVLLGTYVAGEVHL